MSTWGTHRKFSIIAGIGLIILIGMVGGYFRFFYEPANCFDGELNQSEIDIDCGGGCEKVCTSEADALSVSWVRVLPVRAGVYAVAAYIENPNLFALDEISYHIKMYDSNSLLVRERDGVTYANPDEQFVIIEHNFLTGLREASQATIEFTGQSEWKRTSGYVRPLVSVLDKELEDGAAPRVRAVVRNDSLRDIETPIEFSVLVYDASNTVIAGSTSFLESLKEQETKEVFFTWPAAFKGKAAFVEVSARTKTVIE